MLTPDPTKRLTLAQIKLHPFMKEATASQNVMSKLYDIVMTTNEISVN
jgi:hypothetical protein